MRIAFIVNELSEIRSKQTTWQLAWVAARRGHDVWLIPVDGLERTFSGDLLGHGIRLPPTIAHPSHLDVLGTSSTSLRQLDGVFIRTNPARDERVEMHSFALDVLEELDQQVPVLNAPHGLRRASGKWLLTQLPADTVPRTLIATSATAIRAALGKATGPLIAKPLYGTQGQGVAKLVPGDPNAAMVSEMLLDRGPVVLQDFVPEATSGDTRVILLEGEPLCLQGRIAAVRRRPPTTDFRSNIAVGGRAERAALDTHQLETLEKLKPTLHRLGLWMAGVDLIGTRVVEVNVFSSGGLGDASRFEGVDFLGETVNRIEAKLRGQRQRSAA